MSHAAGSVDASLSPAARPLATASAARVASLFDAALRARDGALGAHCIHELWMRGEFAARIEAALAALWRSAAASVPEWLPMRYIEWLPAAYETALGFAPRRRGRTNVYLILLDFADRRRGPYGVYVGLSRYTPAERFDQHKAGIHAAGSVLKRGLEVLTGPTLHLQRVARAEAERIEASLARALADAGLLVEGGH
ncbi:MAG TPA: hypothetical protein VEU78_07565 [Steroidobacteraceae bacterium]|nr:hypothetical protein [Steroidobacteraceae bacterium]